MATYFYLWKVAKIVRVCAMLHNICVDRWVINNPSRFGRGLQHWPEAAPQWGTDDLSPADDEIIERLHNNYVTAKARSIYFLESRQSLHPSIHCQRNS
jgi:hypothetical protein